MSSHASTAAAHGRPSVLAMAGWIAFAMLLVYAVLFGGGYIGINDPRWHLLSLALITVGLAVWALVAWHDLRWRPGTAIWPALVLPLASLALSTVLSPYPRLGVEYLAWAVLLVALYLLLVRILATETVRARIGGLALVLGLAIGVVYLLIVLVLWIDWWDMVGRFAVPPLRPYTSGLPFGGPNVVASAMILLTALAYAGLGVGARGRQLGLALLTMVTATTVLVSGSRSAWLALAGALVVVGGLWAVVHRDELQRRLGQRRGQLVLGAGIVGLVVAALAVGPIVLDRLINSGDGGRPSYFAAAWRMFGDSPLVGLGPGNWAARRSAYLEPGELEFVVPHAHNIYLQTAAELGLVGLAAGLVAGISVLWLIFRGLLASDRRRRAYAWVALFGLAYLAVVDLADFYANLPGIVVLWIIPLAMLDGMHGRGLGWPAALNPQLAGRIATGALAVSCAVAVVFLAWADSTSLTSARATLAANEDDWESAYEAAIDAVAADTGQPAHHLTLAVAATHLGEWEQARDAYARSVAVDQLPQAWLGLALATLESEGDHDEVRRAIESAMRMGRDDAAVAYGAGELYDRMGLTEEAGTAYEQALVRSSGLAADPHWRMDTGLSARFDELLDGAIERAGGQGWRLALMAGDPARARSLAAADPQTLDLIDAWDGDRDALARVLDRADRNPHDAGALSAAGLLVERAGDTDSAERYQRMALALQYHVTTLGREVHTAASCLDRDVIPTQSEVHGLWAYRRVTPRELNPGGLRCLVFAETADEPHQTAP